MVSHCQIPIHVSEPARARCGAARMLFGKFNISTDGADLVLRGISAFRKQRQYLYKSQPVKNH